MIRYEGIAKYFDGLRYAFMFRVDDFMLAANEFIDNYGGGEQCIDFKEVTHYIKVSGNPRITEGDGRSTLRLSDGDSVAFELAPSPWNDLTVNINLSHKGAGEALIGLLVENPHQPLAGFTLSDSLVSPTVSEESVIASTLNEGKVNVGEDISLEFKLRNSDGVITGLANGEELIKGKLRTPLSLDRVNAGPFSVPAIIIKVSGNSVVNVLSVCSNEFRVWFDDKYYKRFTKSLIDLANEYGIRIVWGVVTRGYKRRTYFKPVDKTVDLILKNNQHEYASHTSHHLHAPPPTLKRIVRRALGRASPPEGYRDFKDVADGVRDLNKVLSRLGRKVITHIYPYGEESPIDWKAMNSLGVYVGLDTCEKLESINDIRDWRLVCRTGKIDRHTNVNDVLNELRRIKEAGGVALYMTHAHTFDWDSRESMISSLKELFEYVGTDKDAWITTPGEFYEYIKLSKAINVACSNRSCTVVGVDDNATALITLKFKVGNTEGIKVLKDGVELLEGMCRSMHGCREHYRLEGNYLYVTIKPRGKCVIKFEAKS